MIRSSELALAVGVALALVVAITSIYHPEARAPFGTYAFVEDATSAAMIELATQQSQCVRVETIPMTREGDRYRVSPC